MTAPKIQGYQAGTPFWELSYSFGFNPKLERRAQASVCRVLDLGLRIRI